MNNESYRELIFESSSPYASVKIIGAREDNNYPFIEVNDAFCKMIERNREELLQSKASDFFELSVMGKLLIEYKKEVNYTYKKYGYTKLQDKIYTVEIYTVDNSLYHILFTEINHCTTQISNIFKKTPLIFWVKDLEGRYMDVNETFLKYARVNYYEVIGKTHLEVWGCDRDEEPEVQDREVVEKDELITYNDKIINGESERLFETSKWPLKNNNKTIGVIGISLEMPEKVKLNKIIENTEQNFLDMANNMDEVIIIHDNEKALYVSPYYERLFRCSAKPVYESINNLLYSFRNVKLVEYDIDENNDLKSNLFKITKEDGEEQWIHLKSVSIRNHTGKIIRKIAILKDVTEEKKIDEKLQELRNEFFSNVSHDIRNPINVIMSSLFMINLRLPEVHKSPINKYLDIIKQNNLRLVRLVNNLIDINKIDFGSFEFNPQNRDIVSFIERIVDTVVDFVENRDLEIVFDTDIEEKIVSFDYSQLERALYNLISNAIKFNKPKGKIIVSISTEDNINISVKDTGIGIPRDKIEKIFDRFKQVNKHSSREREGSGIGLSLVKSIVEIHGGKIKVNSLLGEESEFIITLPDVLPYEGKTENVEIKEDRVNRIKVEFSDIYKET